MPPHSDNMKSYRSGRLGEAFCRDTFGIGEPKYEIKSTGASNCAFVVQAWQLFESLWKQYIIIHYRRETRVVSRGDNKGKRRFTETIEQAYAKHLDIYVIRGWKIAKVVLDRKLTLYCTAKNGDIMTYGKWGLVYRVPRAALDGMDLVEQTERYSLYSYENDPPQWHGDAAASTISDGLFCERQPQKAVEEVPF